MRKWVRSHLTYANVMATLAVFLVFGGIGYAATGGNFLLGKSNTASSTSSLSAPVNGKALNLTNASTGAGATALGLNVASGHAPFTVNSGTKVANLNADKLDGTDSSGFLHSGNVKSLSFEASAASGPTTIASVGPYTLKATCSNNGTSTVLHLDANGPAGAAHLVYDKFENDSNTNHFPWVNNVSIPANTNQALFFAQGDYPGRERLAGTAMLATGSTVVQVDFNALADGANTPTANCALYGTAMMGT